MKLLQRRVLEGRVTRTYKRGGILLSVPGETLEQMTEGAIPEGSPEGGGVEKCLLCDKPSAHWGMFMSGEDAVTFMERKGKEAAGTLFGLCEAHNPHESEDEVCDEVYEILETGLKIEADLEIAETVVNTWLDELIEQGYGRKKSLGIILLKLREGGLIEGYEFPEEIVDALEIAIKHEMRKEVH